MSTLHFQRVRFCTQCKEPLPKKCDRCLEHPERTPKVIELYDFPKILRTAECGCCVEISCQASGCSKSMWRHVNKHYKSGKWPAKTFCCSQRCAALTASMSRKTGMKVLCSCGCGQKIYKEMWALKMNRYVYANSEHCYKHRRQMAHDAKEEIETKVAYLQCLNGCVGDNGDKITIHSFLGKQKYKCDDCGKEREARSNATDLVATGR
jgi:hypothetical protein